MTRIRELISAVTKAYPEDRLFENFAESCRMDEAKKRYYQTYEDALRLLDSQSWQVLKDKAVKHFRDHRKGQRKQGFFNQLNEAFAYRHLVQRKYANVQMLSESQKSTPDIRYFESGRVKHCEVKTLGISDEEIQRRRPGPAYDGIVYTRLGDGFFTKFRKDFEIARTQINAQGAGGLVYLVVLCDDWSLAYYNEYRQQLVSYCRERDIHDVYIKVGLRGNRRVRITNG